MKITDLIVRRFAQLKGSDMAHADGHEIIVVNVETDEGITGTSFIGTPIFSHGEVGDVVATLIRRNLRNIVLGENPLHIERLWERMYDAPWRLGMRGMILDCIAAVDFALWDIKGKMLNVPTSHLLGDHRDKILTYANVGQQLAPEKMGEKAAEYVEQGHTAVKIRAGLSAVSLKEATERVEAVREAIGPDVKLLVDINGTWDADTAIEKLKEWRKYNVYWLEEPVPPEDIIGYSRVKERAGDTYIVGGEQHSKLNDFRQLIEHNVDIIQPNASCTGGITSWLKIYQYATNFSIPVAPWNLQQIHMPLAAGLSNVKWIEYFTPDRKTFQNTLLKGPIFEEERLDDGIYLKSSNAPGLGIEINEEVAEETIVG
ncbi:mandelate racemase/muconate lactonizing enzyme family protein [Virgibacillus ainsalahensis]